MCATWKNEEQKAQQKWETKLKENWNVVRIIMKL